MDKTRLTPAMRQFLEIKEKFPDHIVFFRMGDFYEMFFEDAVKASNILGIALTKRNSKGGTNEAPMCGVPYHAYESYAAKLLKAGQKVVIVEQVEDPKKAKGIVKRDVVAVLTPATSYLGIESDSKRNFLSSIYSGEKRSGLVIGDPTTGEISVFEFSGKNSIEKMINQMVFFEPKEVIAPFGLLSDSFLRENFNVSPALNEYGEDYFNEKEGEEKIKELFNVSTIAGFGLKGKKECLKAIDGYLNYLEENYRTEVIPVKSIVFREVSDYLIIDSTTRRNLELFETAFERKKKGSFFWAIDRTKTPQGKRKLSDFIMFPLKSIEGIESRLNFVEWLIESEKIDEIDHLLSYVGDIERIFSKVVLNNVKPSELNILKQSLAITPALINLLKDSPFKDVGGAIFNLEEVFTLIDRTVTDNPPAVKGMNVIKKGVNPELDALREIVFDVKASLRKFEDREREKTGIQNLKVRFNKVFGYYIEISKANLRNGVPEGYERKQTLVNAERFITKELKEFEQRVLKAEERILEIELDIYQQLLDRLKGYKKEIFATAEGIAILDVLLSFAKLAIERDYRKPEITEKSVLYIEQGRHPVVEIFEGENFVPNDTALNKERRIAIITGPNMGGKSTYLRQNALIVLLAHIGSFVPARKAVIGLTDRLFSRVGAGDNLTAGQSTFMVEMIETANILNNATARSLIVLDEIGRGTATFDGLSLAWAITEFLAKREESAPLTFFATHYHELTEIERVYSNVANYNVVVKEWNRELLFLRKVVPGAADKSYGIHVARLAGLPKEVIKRAFEVLENIEKNEFSIDGKPKIARQELPELKEKPLFVWNEHPIIEELSRIKPDEITPLEALQLLYRLKKLL